MTTKTNGMALIRAERQRQIQVEGWTPEHDQEHGTDVLTRAANAYYLGNSAHWPWDSRWWKPKDPLSNLIRSGALYLAAAEVRGEPRSTAAERCAEEIDGILTKAREVLYLPVSEDQ